jgi:SAM-dependent methyltransferase
MEAYQQRIYEHYLTGQRRGGDDRDARRHYLHAVIRRHLPPDRTCAIVDLGCGSGAFVHFLREAGYEHVVGVDASPEQIDAARAMGIPGVVLRDSSDWLLEQPDASCDVVISFDTIEHMGKAELLACADEVRRVLAPGGRWIVHTANAQGMFGAKVRWSDVTHEQAFTRESLTQIFSVAGFADASFHEDRPIVHGVKSAIRRFLYGLFRFVVRLYWIAETGEMADTQIFSQNILAVAVKGTRQDHTATGEGRAA